MAAFLDRYNDELSALRRRAADFAKRHPKIAGRLRMTGDAVDDPHVERIVQSFAYTAARIRQKLDDDFPELTDALLEALYPQYLAQIPSMSIVRIEPAAKADEMVSLPAGLEIETEAIAGDHCRYTTTQPVELAPLRVTHAGIERPPYDAPKPAGIPSRGCLSVTIERTDDAPIGDLDLDRLPFFINAQFATAAAAFELIVNRTRAISVGSHAGASDVRHLAASNLRPGGFEDSEAMLPFPKNSFPGFRLLTEFFAMPEKFLFFSLSGLRPELRNVTGSSMTLWFHLDAAPDALVRAVGRETLELHCSPVVNLFAQRAEPIRIDQRRHEYDLVPDARRSRSREIHSIRRVLLSDSDGRREEVQPFFGRKPASLENRSPRFWQHKRLMAEDDESFSSKIAFVDLSLQANTPDPNAVIGVETWCINRGLPELLPYGGGQPFLKAIGKADQLGKLSMLLPPSATARFDRGDGSQWRLISHLTLNHLPLTAGDPNMLRDILRLYDFRQAQETGTLIEAIRDITSKRTTARLRDGSIVNGIDIDIEFDDASVDRGMAYLFGTVLSRFLGLYASINTFSRLTVRLAGVVVPVARFEPRTSDTVLL